MDLKIKGKKAMVFGASTGLGRAVAKSLADEGVTVGIASRNLDKLKVAAEEVSTSHYYTADMAQKNSAVRAIAQFTQENGDIDILVVNTGGPKRGNFATTSIQDWTDSYQGLWGSTMECLQAVLPSMQRNKWGRILLITSAAAKEPMANLIISNSYRAGLLGLTKSLSNEYAEFGITINALLPGYTKTQRVLETGTPLEKIAANIPAKRLGEPEEFAALACFLASQPAAYISGQAIAVDGGYLKGI